jgi:CHAT domain-containing protein
MDLLRGSGTQAIHFAGHGRFDPDAPDDSIIELLDTSLKPSDVALATIGSTDRPIMFVNACEIGNRGWSLTQIGGWADAFCDVKFTAFVGPYWAVDDAVAHKAALRFYEELRGKATLGEAMRTVRRQYLEDKDHPYHPSWLAYTLHCHPNVTVTLEEAGD